MYRLAFLTFCLAFLAACGDDHASWWYEEDDPTGENLESSASQNGANSSGTRDNVGKSSGSSTDTSAVSTDIIEEPVIEDTTQVSDASKIPDCTAANEGEAMMVTSENAIYFCSNGEWVSNVVETVGVSCKNGSLVAGTSLPDSARISVFGLDSITGEYVYRREGVAVAGLAEKGPFRYGASVSITELDSTMRLDASDRVHSTCIVSADGAYSFENLDFVSPYVRVSANGYYKNEVTGGLSADRITLSAVTDLTERDSVNVNILTHLEAPRTLKLVENTGNNRPIRDMKAQALKDILYSFGFVIEGFNESSFMQQAQGQNVGMVAAAGGDGKYADDISLFGDGDFSAVLMALSIMMQRNGSGEAMVAYADGIADRIRGNGNWDDWAARADLADWLMALDTSGTIEKIRSNVAGWKLGDVPDFEKYLRKFWTKEYGFADCDKSNDGVVTHIASSQSKYFGCNYPDTTNIKTRFVCDASLGRWRAATDIEKDTVGLGADTSKYDGAIRPGVINKDKSYVYESSTGKWHLATSDDIMEFADVEEVYKGLAANESVVFVLRHAERTNETGNKGHLTDNGKAQAKNVGAKFKNVGRMYFAYSGYTRTLETCEGIATGAGVSASPDSLAGLDGEWFVKSGDPSIEDVSRWAYTGSPAGSFYNLEERSEELVSDYILARRSKLQKVNFYISHDRMILPFAVYASKGKVDLRFFDAQGTRNWINYLAGVAVIFDTAGKVRYLPVRGLESGTMRL